MVRFSVVETLSRKSSSVFKIHVIEALEEICLCECIEFAEIADHAGGRSRPGR